MELTSQQKSVFEAVKDFLDGDASVFILRGYAGTGKTTMVKTIADYIAATKRLITLMAPTGRAARVLQAKTGHRAHTIHKAIYGKVAVATKESKEIADMEFKFVYPIKYPQDLEGAIVAIVDEASMLCSRTIKHELFAFGTDNLMDDLLSYVRPAFGGKVIFVGDPAQLPPVGEAESNALCPSFFRERGLKVEDMELTELLRQQEDSLILRNAMMIRDLLKKEKRNQLAFEERKGDVESIPSERFLDTYLDYRKSSGRHDSVVICYSNKSASTYNHDIRRDLYGADVPLQANDILLITQNNYSINRMNGEFVPVLSIGERVQQSALVFVQKEGVKQRVHITLNFVQVMVPDGDGHPVLCMLLEDLLTSGKATLSIDEHRALYINFCIRHPELKQGTEMFANALQEDPYYNALRATYGYAVTGHKCQGGEWGKVFVDYAGRNGLDNDSLRWAYTATTRAQKTLYFANLSHITPFSKFRIDPVQTCKHIDAEFRVLREVDTTPFHDEKVETGVRAKYHCIAQNLQDSPYTIANVQSKPYLEIYYLQTPDGIDRYDLHYKAGAVFLPAKPPVTNAHTPFITALLDDERSMPNAYEYTPSDETHRLLYNFIRSACNTLSIQLTNVVEHQEDYSTIYYLRISGTYSYIKVYVNAEGFVTYAKPMSLKGQADEELGALLYFINANLQ